jgi:hypothetical protein
MRRSDFLKNMESIDKIRSIKASSQEIPCMEIYAPILEELFTLPSEDWELDETTNNIEDVVEIAISLYEQKRYGESLSLLTQLIVTLNNHFEQDGWYSMFDDFNSMDHSEARYEMMDLFEKLLQDIALPQSLTGPVLQTLKVVSDDNVLANYTSWDISPLVNPQDKSQDNDIQPNSPEARFRYLYNLRREYEQQVATHENGNNVDIIK